MDASNVACVVLDDEKNIETIFLQSRKQRDWFDKFPELDGTFQINNAGMALYDILVEDGFGSSYVVAYCFCCTRNKGVLGQFSSDL